MKFNVNNYVRVQLTDVGREIHRARYESINYPNKRPYIPRKEDEDGWSEWQLWELMQVFGPHISLGCRLPFDSVIEINQ